MNQKSEKVSEHVRYTLKTYITQTISCYLGQRQKNTKKHYKKTSAVSLTR